MRSYSVQKVQQFVLSADDVHRLVFLFFDYFYYFFNGVVFGHTLVFTRGNFLVGKRYSLAIAFVCGIIFDPIFGERGFHVAGQIAVTSIPYGCNSILSPWLNMASPALDEQYMVRNGSGKSAQALETFTIFEPADIMGSKRLVKRIWRR